MGTIRITETSRTGEISSTVEYEFSDFQDYISWRNLQSKQLKDSLMDIFGGIGELPGEEQQAEIVDMSVGKKKTEPTRH
jgi:hypothetical protein